MMMDYIEQCKTIRELAKELRELSGRPENSSKRQNWADHNDLNGNTKSMLWVCPDDDGGWLELLPESEIVCKNKDLRELEIKLRRYIYHANHFDDDFVFEPVVYFNISGDYTGYHYGCKNQKNVWGISVESKLAGKNAYHLDNYLKDPTDFETLLSHEVDFVPDSGELNRLKEKYNDAVDGIINIQFNLPYSVLVQSLLIELVHLRGLEELMYDLYDNGELLSRVLEHMSASKARLLDRLEANNQLFDNRINIYTGSGSLGYTNAALKKPEDIRLCDMWGFADAQEFSNVSPEMFENFAIKYQKAGLNKFGMGCYGCCEPLDNKYDIIFKHMTNVRRLSVSPWSNVRLAAENIAGKAIFSWKPNPVLLCCGFDEDKVYHWLRDVAGSTKNCSVEIILKDIRTCAGTPEHLQKFIKLVNKTFM
jgi:hypothetical protein